MNKVDDVTFGEFVDMTRAELPLQRIWTVASQDDDARVEER